MLVTPFPDVSRPVFFMGGGRSLMFSFICAVAALLGADCAFAKSVITVGLPQLADAGTPAGIRVLRPGNADDPVQMHVVRADAGSSGVALEVASGRITVSRASDIVGRPVDIYRPVHTGHTPSGLPLSSALLTSGFGMRRHPILGGYRAHNGVDLAAPTGTPIFAPSDGVVSRADWNGGYGLFVELNHGGATQTLYGHLSRLKVAPGQKVKKGEVIGYVGSTGRSTGAHLHYEMRVNGQPINPLTKKP